METGVAFRKVLATARLPSMAHANDAAYDVYAAEDGIVLAGQRAGVRTGLAMASCPSDFHPQLCSRSGLAVHESIDVCAGIIDPGYRGEIHVVLHNHGSADFVYPAGARIAQMRFVRIARPDIAVTEAESPATSRGTGGFGSSGI